MRTACGQPCSTVAQLAPSSRIGHARFHATDEKGVSCHITLATAVPPLGEGRAPAAGTNHAPAGDRQAVDGGPFLSRTQGSSAPLGESRAPAAGTNHAPPGDRQAPAVDEGPFLPRTQGSAADPDKG